MTEKPRREVWDERLMTHVEGVAYDFRTREGRLYLPELCCCDRGGALALFTAIDSKVEVVRTFAGDKADMVFLKKAGEWETFWPSCLRSSD
jgi:hypothetical protein